MDRKLFNFLQTILRVIKVYVKPKIQWNNNICFIIIKICLLIYIKINRIYNDNARIKTEQVLYHPKSLCLSY